MRPIFGVALPQTAIEAVQLGALLSFGQGRMLVLALVMVGCIGTDDHNLEMRHSVVVLDSAGTGIVESRAPLWKAGLGWRLSTTPVLTIGSVSGQEGYVFTNVVAGSRLEDGSVVLADATAGELRVFDRRGALLRHIGARGEGPGEFRWLTTAWIREDGVWAFDNALGRVSKFALDGSFVNSFRVAMARGYGRPAVRAQFTDGSLVVLSAPPGVVPSHVGVFEGATWMIQRYADTGEYLSGIAPLKESPRWGHDIAGLPPGMPLPFYPSLGSLAVSGNSVYVGRGIDASVHRWNKDGSLSLVIRWAAPRRAVTAEVRDRYRRAKQTPPPPFDASAWNRYLDQVPFPDEMAVYQRLVIDATGCLWVQQFPPLDGDSSSWFVFDVDGAWLGTVDVPTNLRILEIGMKYVLGVQRDRLDVPVVVVIPLDRDASSGPG